MSDADRAAGIGSAGAGLAGPHDPEAVFEALQARLDQISKSPIVRNDPVARDLLDDMGRTGDMEDILPLLDRLDARVAHLLRRKGAAAPDAGRRRERAARTLLRL